jgi:AcrR family transcriptional regulator
MPSDLGNKDRLLDLAEERFLGEGISKVSVDDLTRELSMSKKTFYMLFESKEDLAVQMVERKVGQIRGEIERIVGGSGDFIDKLHGLLAFIGTVIRTIGGPGMHDMKRQMPHLWRRIEEYRRDRIRDVFSRLLEQGITEGTVRRDLNKRVFALAWLGAVEGVVQPDVLAQESFSEREAVSALVAIAFTGIMTDEGRNEFLKRQHTHTYQIT